MFQKKGSLAFKAGLRNIDALDEFLEHPHQHYPTIHIAGTNGKGSVAHMLAAILQTAGLKVGLYTSPHYKDFRERIKINGQLAEKQFFIDFINRIESEVKDIRPSFFELSVAMAFQYFKEQKIDIAIIETGLGGRTDSTNIIKPILSIITNISYDHQNVLGNTLEAIAHHKAGIIKRGRPVVIGETHPETSQVFLEEAKQKHSNITFADQKWKAELVEEKVYESSYRICFGNELWEAELLSEAQGSFQALNIQTVLESVYRLNDLEILPVEIAKESIVSGIKNLRSLTYYIGRWQMLSRNPLVLVDSAHNIGGMKYIVKQLAALSYDQLHMVLGLVREKDHRPIFEILPKEAAYYFAKANVPRGMEADKLASMANEHGLHGKAYSSVSHALNKAKESAKSNDLIFVGGSIYVVAEVLTLP